MSWSQHRQARRDVNAGAGRVLRASAGTSRFIGTNSTASKLARSSELYDEVRQTNTEFKGLIADIKAHPDKYVKVKFSLFK